MNDSLLDYFYQKYKKYILSIVIVILSIVIVWQVAIPQVFSILERRDDIEKKQAEVATLEESLTTLNSFNDSNLDNDIQTATTALPSSKEFLAMYLGVVSAAGKAQVDIKDYSTKIGTLYTRQGSSEIQEKTSVGGPAPSLLMNVTVDAGSPAEVQNFTESLHAVLPLAETKKISYTNGEAQYEILFYYSTVNPSLLAKQVNINALTPAERKLLEQLSAWKQEPPVVPTGVTLPSSTPSASSSSQIVQ